MAETVVLARTLWGIGLLAFAGCARPLPPVTATVHAPAPAPITCATEVHFIDGVQVATMVRRLATALAASGTPASVMPHSVALAHRENGTLAEGSVVVQLQLTVDEGVQFVPMAAGAGGHHAWGKARGSLTVLDGRSGAVLQTLPIDANAGNAAEAMTKAEQQISTSFRVEASSLQVPMPVVSDPAVARAVSEMRQWRWTEARRALEELEGCCSADPEEEAAYQYVLGVARRFDPETLVEPQTHFAMALEALTRAAELAPDEVIYLNAVSATRGEAEGYRLLEEQRQLCESRGRRLPVADPRSPDIMPAPVAPGAVPAPAPGVQQRAPNTPGGIQPAPTAPPPS